MNPEPSPVQMQDLEPCERCNARGFVPVDAVDVWVIEANHGSKLAVFHKPGLRSSTPASLVLHEEIK